MNTELWIDSALVILALAYLIVGTSIWRDCKAERKHRQDMRALEKTVARARQVREFAEARLWK